jgi:hypothetical protein
MTSVKHTSLFIRIVYDKVTKKIIAASRPRELPSSRNWKLPREAGKKAPVKVKNNLLKNNLLWSNLPRKPRRPNLLLHSIPRKRSKHILM